eukprot:gene8640-1047_t
MVAAKRILHPLPLLDEEIVLQECRKRGINQKHAYSMWRHIIAKKFTNVDEIPELPKALYQLVKEKFSLLTSKLEDKKTSADGSTTKLLIRLQDGALIETVIMRYGRFELSNFPAERQRRTENGETVFASKSRATVCVSSQVGCKMGCTFCATGTMGLLSNLTAGEILEQLYHANSIEPIRNVVFMGMGEPLDNYSAVVSAVRGMTDVRRFSLSSSRIAVSTVGVVPKMLKMAEDIPEVGLALSLHAPTQELRAQIVPSAKAWRIDRILAAMNTYLDRRTEKLPRRGHVLIEYVLIDNVNSSEEVAHQLGGLLQGLDVILNVIPYNPTDVPHDYKAPSEQTLEKFNEILRQYELRTIVRQELGQDVNAACGQLVISSSKKDGSGIASCSTDIEELYGFDQPTQQAEKNHHQHESNRTEKKFKTTHTADKFRKPASSKVSELRHRNAAHVSKQVLNRKTNPSEQNGTSSFGFNLKDNRLLMGLCLFLIFAAIRLIIKVSSRMLA